MSHGFANLFVDTCSCFLQYIEKILSFLVRNYWIMQASRDRNTRLELRFGSGSGVEVAPLDGRE